MTLQRLQLAVAQCINRRAIVHQVHLARKFTYQLFGCSNTSNNKRVFILFSIRSPRCLSPANQAGGYYDDIDDYSPVVSDIEDQNEDDIDSKIKSKRKDDMEKDNNDILQKILNEQSASKCELEEENVSDQGEHDDADELKESKCLNYMNE